MRGSCLATLTPDSAYDTRVGIQIVGDTLGNRLPETSDVSILF
jgi:hypothetical protein